MGHGDLEYVGSAIAGIARLPAHLHPGHAQCGRLVRLVAVGDEARVIRQQQRLQRQDGVPQERVIREHRAGDDADEPTLKLRRARAVADVDRHLAAARAVGLLARAPIPRRRRLC